MKPDIKSFFLMSILLLIVLSVPFVLALGISGFALAFLTTIFMMVIMLILYWNSWEAITNQLPKWMRT